MKKTRWLFSLLTAMCIVALLATSMQSMGGEIVPGVKWDAISCTCPTLNAFYCYCYIP